MERSSLLWRSTSLTTLEGKWTRTLASRQLEMILWLAFHWVTKCSQGEALQEHWVPAARNKSGLSPISGIPLWKHADLKQGRTLALCYLPLSHRGPSLMIAHSKTYLYVRVTWPREPFCDAPRLKHCWRMNENGWRVTLFSCSKFESLNSF